MEGIGRNISVSKVGVGGTSESYSNNVCPLRRLSKLDVLGKDNAGDDKGGVIIAGVVTVLLFPSRLVVCGNVKWEEMASERRCVCREAVFMGIDGVEVNDRGEPGGEVGNGSFDEERCNEGIDSK
jgi:hypothetical protein